MTQERQADLGDSDLGQAALAPCDLLDRYWSDLEHKPGSEPQPAQIDHLSADRCFHTDLGTLRLLHQIRVSDHEGRLSQVGTVRLEHPAGWPSSTAQFCNEQQLPKPEEPQRIGRYIVIEQLDAGGQGEVFRVLHPELDKQYVLKLARRPTKQSPDAPGAEGSSLHREGMLLAQCDHPNLVRVIDLDMHNGRAFVVMEHVPGLTLEQYVLQHRPGARQAARIVAKLACAVSYLHSRGIIHQDIKPKNILIDAEGQPRLIDFGLARQQDAWTGEMDKKVGGTVVYMSPEQALGLADRIGPSTDILGLGGLLYYLLTGRPLYQGASEASVRWQAMRCQYVPIRQLNRRVPWSLERLCRKALAAQPELRHVSACELKRALTRFQIGRRLAGTGLAALLVTGFATAVEWPPASRPGNSSIIVTASARPTIDVLAIDHHGYRDGTLQWSMPMGLSSRPVSEGDGAFVSARLSAPAFGFLVALNPDGKVQLCAPPDCDEPPRQSSEIRFEGTSYFPFTDGPGLQVFLVLASRRPLPPFARWSGSDWLKGHWSHIAADRVPGVWRHDGRVATLVSSVTRGPMRKGHGPPEAFDEVCKYLATLPEIDVIQSVAFPVRSRESGAAARVGRGESNSASQ
jgi:serine/threonine protein kinase